MDNIRLRIYEIGGNSDLSSLRLLEWLSKSDLRESHDAYRVYGWLHQRKHMISKRNAVNLNKALRSDLPSNLNGRTVNANKALRQERGYADTPIDDSACASLIQSIKSGAPQAESAVLSRPNCALIGMRGDRNRVSHPPHPHAQP